MADEENRLRGFLYRTRLWSKADRGSKLLHLAAEALRDWAEVDAGFFVYQRRLVQPDTPDASARIFESWGPFADDPLRLESWVEAILESERTVLPLEQWVEPENTPEPIRTDARHFGIAEFGLWPIAPQGHQAGYLVAARTRRKSEAAVSTVHTQIIDVCAAQIALGLDLMFATRLAEEARDHDLLTGLLNRRGLIAKWTSLSTAPRQSSNSLIVGVLDINNLKRINDDHGHPAGDAALQKVGEILRHAMGPDDLVARWGGDEFLVVLETNQATAMNPTTAMLRLQAIVARESNGLSAAVGGALWTQEGLTLEACYHVADARLYENKRWARSNY